MTGILEAMRGPPPRAARFPRPTTPSPAEGGGGWGGGSGCRLLMSSRSLAVCLTFALVAGDVAACVEGDLRGEAVMLERDRGAKAEGEHTGLQILGAGWFRAVSVVKTGGTTDETTVTVELDGEPMMSTSFAALKNAWRQVESVNLVGEPEDRGQRRARSRSGIRRNSSSARSRSCAWTWRKRASRTCASSPS